MRAKRGQIQIASTATMIVRDWPSVTTSTSATRISGNDSSISTRRMINSSTHFPYQPAISPRAIPRVPPTPSVTAAIISEILAP